MSMNPKPSKKKDDLSINNINQKRERINFDVDIDTKNRIKIRAIEKNKSIKDYVLYCIEQEMSR